MKPRKKLFLLITAIILIVFVSRPLIEMFVKSQGVSFFLRSLLVLLAIYLLLEILNLLRPGSK